MKLLKKAISWLLVCVMAFSVTIPVSAAEITLPDNEAIVFVNNLGAAWNLGNAFDSANCSWLSNELDYESGWCGAKTTKKLIETLADVGFRTIRVPVSWHNHVDSNNNISEAWINRVQEVVDWCLEEDLYVILNVHHDVEENYYFPTSAKYSTSEKYLTDVWKQIAEKFKNYDNRLIFETINEPRIVGSNYEWWFTLDNPPAEIIDSVDCINRLNQAALNTIRAAGGKNSDRYVLIPGYDTSVDGLTVNGFEMPTDTAKNRLIANFHLYTLDTSTYQSVINRVYETYVKKGIPAILSEYNQDASRNKYDSNSVTYLGGLVSYARERGITCVIWDNNADEFKLINRADSAWVHKDIAEAVVANGTKDIEVKVNNSPEITSAAAGDGKVTLTWAAAEGATSYSVYYYINGAYRKAGETTSATYTVSGLANGTKYGFLVRAYVNGKWSAYTEEDIVYATPVAPVGSKPVVTAYAGNGKVRLNWTKVNGATKYAVYTYSGGKYTLYKNTTLNYYNVTGLTNGTKMGFLVRAYVNGKWSSFTTADIVYATPVAKPVVTAYAGNGKVRLNWGKVSGATKYAIYTYAGGKYTLYKATTLNACNVTGLTNGTAYTFLVRAYVNGKWTAYNAYDRVSATPVDKPVITKTVAADGRVRLYWNKVNGATKYAIYTYSGGKYILYRNTTATAYTVSGLTNGTSYGFLVRAYVNGKWTTYNAYDRVTAAPKAASTAPQNVKITLDGSDVTISWSAVSGATRYDVQRWFGSFWVSLNYTTATSYTDETGMDGIAFKYRVLADVNGTWSEPSSEVSVTIGAVKGNEAA